MKQVNVPYVESILDIYGREDIIVVHVARSSVMIVAIISLIWDRNLGIPLPNEFARFVIQPEPNLPKQKNLH
jgi:hypothetical protein